MLSEYILRLRQHIVRQDAGKRSAHLHIDRDTYWRELHEQSEIEKAQLRDKIFALERKNDILEARLKADNASTSKKRKADSSKDAPPGPSSKRPRAGKRASTAESGNQVQDTFDEDLDLFNLAGDGTC